MTADNIVALIPGMGEYRGLEQTKKNHYSGKRECCELMKALSKCCNYVYAVRFLVETDTNTLEHQLHMPPDDMARALVTCSIGWIQLFDFDLKHIPGRLNRGPDNISGPPRGEEEPVPEEKDDLEETIEASLRGIRVERGPESQRRETAH